MWQFYSHYMDILGDKSSNNQPKVRLHSWRYEKKRHEVILRKGRSALQGWTSVRRPLRACWSTVVRQEIRVGVATRFLPGAHGAEVQMQRRWPV